MLQDFSQNIFSQFLQNLISAYPSKVHICEDLRGVLDDSYYFILFILFWVF